MRHIRALLITLGILIVIVPWGVIFSAMRLNPWFDPLRGAFSDLGGPRSSYPWVFNEGLVISALILAAFSLALISISENKTEGVGGSFMLVASMFLAMIGIFHEGTYPHDFVSLWFFVQADMAIAALGLGRLPVTRKSGAFLTAWSFVGIAVAVAIRWPSTATLEAFGISALDLAVIILLLTISFGDRRETIGRGSHKRFSLSPNQVNRSADAKAKLGRCPKRSMPILTILLAA